MNRKHLQQFQRKIHPDLPGNFNQCLQTWEVNEPAAVIRKQEDHIAFKVEDNGKGFAMLSRLAGVPIQKGTGIAAMREVA